MISSLRLTDSLTGLTIAYLGADVPFCTWLLMGYFRSVPVELEEAALVDGCNRISALIRIVLPLALPAIVVVTFFSFTRAWNEFLYAHVFTSTNQARTITTGLANFMNEDVFFWGPLMASTIISAILPVVMFLILQRWRGAGADAGRGERIGRYKAYADTTRHLAPGRDGCCPGDDGALVAGAPGPRGAR